MTKFEDAARRAPGHRGHRVLPAFLWLLLWFPCFAFPAGAQEKSGLGTGYGLPETIEAIERARVATRVLYVTAHPDDESGAVLAWLARGAYADVALLSLTRGEGGQNALGPEQAPQLGLLRTEELLAACRFYGVKLYFGGAADFGFSKLPEEALKIWGEPVLANMVRVIREFRPHIIINNWGGVRTGHGQHQAAGILTPQAMEAAADPARFPEQLRNGLRPWRTRSLLQFARGSFPGATGNSKPEEALQIPAQLTAPLWGKSYNEIGVQGYTQHRTQGVAAAGSSPFFRGSRSVMLARGEAVVLEDFSKSLRSLAAAPREAAALTEADQYLSEAKAAGLKMDWNGAATLLARAARLLRETPFESSDVNLLDDVQRAAQRIDQSLALVAGIRMDAVADRGEISLGSSFTVRAEWRYRATNVEWGDPELLLPSGWSLRKTEKEGGGPLRFTVAAPAGAQPEVAFRMGIVPWPAPPVHVRMPGIVDGYAFSTSTEVLAQRVTTTHLDSLPLLVVPEVTLTAEPLQLVIPRKRLGEAFEIVVRVRYYGTGQKEVVVGVNAPGTFSAGAGFSPPFQSVRFEQPGDQLVRFRFRPGATLPSGSHELKFWAKAEDELFRTSLEPLPTLPTRLWSDGSATRLRVIEVAVPEKLRVGYVAGDNDPIPAALRQIGIQVEMLDESALAFGDLKRYDAIALGIRAYELRQDLIRANPRLLDYAAQGGTLLVQYQRDGIWNALKPAPYPALVSERIRPDDPNSPRRDLRTTDESSPVRILRPQHRAMNWPNPIGPADFTGWVQERGLYYWGEFDSRYEPLLGLQDPGEKEVNGALVYAPLGKGHYVFTGLSFFRQLPAGTPGAYRLLVNLLSLSKAEGKK